MASWRGTRSPPPQINAPRTERQRSGRAFSGTVAQRRKPQGKGRDVGADAGRRPRQTAGRAHRARPWGRTGAAVGAAPRLDWGQIRRGRSSDYPIAPSSSRRAPLLTTEISCVTGTPFSICRTQSTAFADGLRPPRRWAVQGARSALSRPDHTPDDRHDHERRIGRDHQPHPVARMPIPTGNPINCVTSRVGKLCSRISAIDRPLARVIRPRTPSLLRRIAIIFAPFRSPHGGQPGEGLWQHGRGNGEALGNVA